MSHHHSHHHGHHHGHHGHHHHHHNHHRHHYSYEQRVHTGNQVSIPHTTDGTVVFPYNGCGKTFERGLYHPSQTDNRATQEHVNQVLSEVEEVLRDKLGCVNCLGYMLLLSFFLVIFAFFLAASSGTPVIAFGAFFGLFALAIITGCLNKKQTQEARIVCHRILDQHNARLKDVGLRWNLPFHFPKWIELNNDFRTQPGYIVQVVQPMPVVVTQPAFGVQPQFQQQGFVQQGFVQQGNDMYYPPQQYQMP